MESRDNPRYPFTAEAEVIELQSGTRIMGRMSDLAREGCYVDTINPFPLGAIVKVRLTQEKNFFEGQAKVVYAQVGMGMGLFFTSAKPEQLWVLEKWLGELSGQLPSHPDAPEPEEQAGAEGSLEQEQLYVLNELIITLMRKGTLTEAEGTAMLRQLLGQDAANAPARR